jgi:hypothetical protein
VRRTSRNQSRIERLGHSLIPEGCSNLGRSLRNRRTEHSESQTTLPAAESFRFGLETALGADRPAAAFF